MFTATLLWSLNLNINIKKMSQLRWFLGQIERREQHKTLEIRSLKFDYFCIFLFTTEAKIHIPKGEINTIKENDTNTMDRIQLSRKWAVFSKLYSKL